MQRLPNSSFCLTAFVIYKNEHGDILDLFNDYVVEKPLDNLYDETITLTSLLLLYSHETSVQNCVSKLQTFLCICYCIVFQALG